DAAIIFSDILVIPEAMGMELEINEGEGPVFNRPIRSEDDANLLKKIEPEKDLKFVLDAVSKTKKELNGRVSLIGFSGCHGHCLHIWLKEEAQKIFLMLKNLFI